MKLASLRDGDELRPALLHADRPYVLEDVARAAHVMDASRSALPHGGAQAVLADPAALAIAHQAAGALEELVARDALTPHRLADLGPPIARPGKIVCVGRNYADHARELGNELPTRPILFAKLATAIRGPFADVERPREVDDLDYEAELAVVIGVGGRRIPRDAVLNPGDGVIAGYMCANDLSARAAQLAMGDQWLRGKSFDGFCPTGPALVTRDEVPDPQRLRIRCRVDGETRQDGVTADMVFDVATLVSYISDAFTLEPGDVILTGTPAGVAMGRTPAPWLQPGQVCEVEIESIGTIANRIVAER